VVSKFGLWLSKHAKVASERFKMDNDYECVKMHADFIGMFAVVVCVSRVNRRLDYV
jgi:hypothetical protein